MIIQEQDYHVGDIVKLKFDTFTTDLSNRLVKENHPFVIVDTEPYIVCEVSSKMDKQYPWNVVIQEWKYAGLLRPSHVKTDQYGEIQPEDIFRVYGTLHKKDLNRVLISYFKSPQNYKFEWINGNFIKTKLCE